MRPSGKHGSGIALLNQMDPSGDKEMRIISLGTHEDSCVGKIPFCPDGATLSFWFKALLQPSSDPYMLASTSLSVQLGVENGTLNTITKVSFYYHSVIFHSLYILHKPVPHDFCPNEG